MTVYWMDVTKMNDANGSGTYASPWNGRATQPIVSGDEVRIKSFDLDTMTEFSFTGTAHHNSYQITSLSIPGTNINLGDVIVSDSTKTAFVVHYNGASHIQVYGQPSAAPFFNASGTVQTFRKIKEEYLSQKSTDVYSYLRPTNQTSNVTYTDGWISETVRKTDLSALTIYTGKKDQYAYVYLGYATNSTFDLRCSCMIPANCMQPYVAGSWTPIHHATLYLDIVPSTNTTFYVHQFMGGNSYGQVYITGSTDLVDCSLTINYWSSYYGCLSGYNGAWRRTYYNNTTIIANNLICHYIATYSANWKNNTNITIKEVFAKHTSDMLLYTGSPPYEGGTDFTITLDGNFYGRDKQASGLVGELSPNYTVNLTSNFNYYYNNVLKNIPYFLYRISSCYQENMSFKDLPTLNNSSSMVTPPNNRARICHTNAPPAYTPNRSQVMPIVVNDYVIVHPTSSNMVWEDYRTADSSYLFVNSTTHETYEELSSPMRYGNSQYSFIVEKEYLNFRTVTPSHSFYLQTFSTSYNNAFYNKVIKLPLQADGEIEFTISGWIKSEVGFFNQGDLIASVIADNGNIMLSDDINIAAAESGWTQFSIDIIPGFPQVADLRIRIKPKAGNKTFWLSDLEVT